MPIISYITTLPNQTLFSAFLNIYLDQFLLTGGCIKILLKIIRTLLVMKKDSTMYDKERKKR